MELWEGHGSWGPRDWRPFEDTHCCCGPGLFLSFPKPQLSFFVKQE